MHTEFQHTNAVDTPTIAALLDVDRRLNGEVDATLVNKAIKHWATTRYRVGDIVIHRGRPVEVTAIEIKGQIRAYPSISKPPVVTETAYAWTSADPLHESTGETVEAEFGDDRLC